MTYNPEKAYDSATWANYVEWLGRLGFKKVKFHGARVGVSAICPDGTKIRWRTKRAMYLHILEMDGGKYDPDA